jgi:hypothetical protein
MEHYHADIEAVRSHRRDNGADLWATPEGNLIKGGPFSTLEAAYLLAELGLSPDDPMLGGAAALIWGAQRGDGRFQPVPKSTVFPCQTIHAVKTLCYLGFSPDARLQKTFEHLLESRHDDGGWRCRKFFFGHGPETEASNPGPTLTALDAFRFTPYASADERLDSAVEFLLGHWETRAPLGPCHYGIGTQFHQLAFPFLYYNIFYYVYVLSFYERARRDARFLGALSVLQGKLKDGRIVVERTHAKLSGLNFCKKGESSDLATEKYHQILNNLE